MIDNYLRLRVIWDDPDIFEIEVELRHSGWVVFSTLYASMHRVAADGASLKAWTFSPDSPHRIEFGADTGIGWLSLEFYKVDRAGHLRCRIQLATNETRRPTPWRCAMDIPTESAMVARFADDCSALTEIGREAELLSLPL